MLYPLKNAEAFNSGRLADFSQVGVRALDDHTLEFILSRPAPYLAAAATLPAWFPVHRASIEKLGRFDDRAVPWTRPENMVCNGPFLLREWSPGNRVVVDRNPDYWDARNVRLNRMVFYPIENALTQEAAFRTGQLHLTSDVPLVEDRRLPPGASGGSADRSVPGHRVPAFQCQADALHRSARAPGAGPRPRPHRAGPGGHCSAASSRRTA